MILWDPVLRPLRVRIVSGMAAYDQALQETDPIPGACTGMGTNLRQYPTTTLRQYPTLLRLSDLIALLEIYGKPKMEEKEELGDGASVKQLPEAQRH